MIGVPCFLLFGFIEGTSKEEGQKDTTGEPSLCSLEAQCLEGDTRCTKPNSPQLLVVLRLAQPIHVLKKFREVLDPRPCHGK